jgi:hypothetical protein
MASSINVKNNHLRGDFYFRDVFQRNTYSSFAGPSYSDSSTLYINESSQVVNCTSQISTFENGIGSLHVFTRNNADFQKGNTLTATVSINPFTTVFRSSNTHVEGGFTVSGKLFNVKVPTQRVGVSQENPAYTLDVGGDCNLAAGNVYRINGAPILSYTLGSAGPSVTSDSLTVTGLSTLKDVNITGNVTGTLASSVVYETTTPFTYNGPGINADIGVPFYTQVLTKGILGITASGDNNNIFTITTEGSYLIQAEIQTGYPWFPEGDIWTYYIKNGDTTKKYGMETHAGANSFTCTRPYLMVLNQNDTIRFIIDSSISNTFEAGIDTCRVTFFKL